MKLTLRLLVIFVASLTALLIMFNVADADKILYSIRNTDKIFIFLAFASQVMIVILTTLRWRFLLKKVGVNLKFKNLKKLVLVSYFVNCITPGAKIGGDASRIYFLNKIFRIEVSKSAATIFAERISDFFVFISLAVISFIYLTFVFEINENVRNKISLILFFFLMLYTGAIKAIFSEKLAKKIEKRIPKKFNFFENFLMFKKRSYSLLGRNVAYRLLTVTVFIWFFEILRTFLILKALNQNVPFLAVAVVTVITLSIATLPILPGNVGITEGIIATFYYSLGIPLEVSISLAIIDRLISYWFLFVVGMVSFLSLGGLKEEYKRDF